MTATVTALNVPGVQAPSKSILRESDTILDVKIIYPGEIHLWDRPGFQRPLNLDSEKLIEMARKMRREAAQDKEAMCEIPDIIKFGRLRGEKQDYLYDGQHRIFGAFAMAAGLKAPKGSTDLDEPDGVVVKCGLANVQIRIFDSMADMARAFADANQKIVNVKPDDHLRAMEYTNAHLRAVREKCPFIGYEKNRSTRETVMISMSTAIRTWFGSGATPAGGPPADRAEKLLDEHEAKQLIAFFHAAEKAGWVNTDKGNPQLWGALNIGINMWLWRKLVLGVANKFRGGGDFTALKPAQYSECMKELRNPEYTKWLLGRGLNLRDRPEAYERLQALFEPAIRRMGVVGIKFPAPQGWGA